MTTGIYLLNFSNQAYYIGQSQDMEARWRQHADKFLSNKSAKKMQDAYNAYGMFEATILIECHKDYLDIMESYFIAQQKTQPNCLNTTAPTLDPSIDYIWLLQNSPILKVSSIDVIREFFTLTQQNKELQTDYNHVKQQLESRYTTTMARAELQDGKDINAELVKYNLDKIAHIESELAKIKNRGFLMRVFNH